MAFVLGCIADDFTGATDLANEIHRQGLRTLLFLDNQFAAFDEASVDAVVIALKIRTAPLSEALQSVKTALQFLQEHDCQHIYYKYCSTFDSTEKGNIGPITEFIMKETGQSFALSSPAFPRTGRTVYKGHLFVGDKLLSDTHMRHHPLTPMTDSNLVRHLQKQSQFPVHLLAHEVLVQGEQAVQDEIKKQTQQGICTAIVDVIEDNDLVTIGRAVWDTVPVIAGASGLAFGISKAWAEKKPSREESNTQSLPPVGGRVAVLAGSCSAATLQQIKKFKEQYPAYKISVQDNVDISPYCTEAIQWAEQQLPKNPILLYSSTTPEELESIQNSIGREQSAEIIESIFATIAKQLMEMGVRRLIVAGGETSGAVVKALQIKAMRIGPEIDPGVPWTIPLRDPPMVLALKSGNFGCIDFFSKAIGMTQ